MDEPALIPGRECGSCNVCCVDLTINEPTLQKAQGFRCRNARKDNSCAIYEDRPRTCRSFFCGWRTLRWVRQTMRPDQSGVLIRLHQEISVKDGTRRMGVVFQILNRAGLKAEGLAESVAAAVAADVPVFLNVPGRPGWTSGQARINDALQHAVVTKDKAAVLDILRECYTRGLWGDRKRIVLSPPPAARAE